MASILGNGTRGPGMMGMGVGGSFRDRMAVPGRVGQGNTGIVPPNMQPAPGPMASTVRAGMGTGGPDPAYPQPPMQTGGSLPPQSVPTAPMGSGTTQPGLPRPPGMPTGTAMSLPRVGPTGLPAPRSNPTGRPAGGLFPRLG